MSNPKSAPIETSIIANDASIDGDIEFVGTLIVEGVLNSTVSGAELIIQEKGSVTGTVSVNTLNCHGSLQGTVKANQLTVHRNAKISGDIETKSIEVEAGALINASLTMSDKDVVTQRDADPSKAKKNSPVKSTKLSEIVLESKK